MADGSWRLLVERYANGRPICNCRNAYYSTEEVTERRTTGGPFITSTRHFCDGGCQANQYLVRDRIAEKVLEEIQGSKT